MVVKSPFLYHSLSPLFLSLSCYMSAIFLFSLPFCLFFTPSFCASIPHTLLLSLLTLFLCKYILRETGRDRTQIKRDRDREIFLGLSFLVDINVPLTYIILYFLKLYRHCCQLNSYNIHSYFINTIYFDKTPDSYGLLIKDENLWCSKITFSLLNLELKRKQQK